MTKYMNTVIVCWLSLMPYFLYSQIGKCISQELLEESLLPFKGQDENSFHITNATFRDKIYSKEMIDKFLLIINEVDTLFLCDSIQEISLIYAYQEQHWSEYVYIIIRDVSDRNFYFTNDPSSKFMKKIGVIEGKDYLLSVANQIFRLESPIYDDYLIVATIEDNKFTSYKATQRFNILRHFQVIAAVEQLIRYSNQ